MPVGQGSAAYRSAGLKGLAAGGDIKTGSGTLESLDLSNLDAAAAWLQIFDAADHTHVTLGVTVPALSIHVASSADKDLGKISYGFNNGLVFAVTTTDGGSSSPATGLAITATYH